MRQSIHFDAGASYGPVIAAWIYAYGVLLNGASLFVHGTYGRVMRDGYWHGYTPATFALIGINAALGLTVST